MKAGNGFVSPKLKTVNIVYLPANQSPVVKLSSPNGGEKWSNKQTIKWTGTDPDKDSLTYEVFYSADNGATWARLKDGIEPEIKPKDGQPKQEKPSTEETSIAAVPPVEIDATTAEEMMQEMNDELSKIPDLPQDIKDKLLAEASAMTIDDFEDVTIQEKGASSTPDKPVVNSTKQTNFNWDTGKMADGIYMFKVVGSDRLSNPAGALTDEAISRPVFVCNKSPRLVAFKSTLTVQADKSVKIEGSSHQDLIGIAGVQYKIDKENDWAAAAPNDGIYDSGFEGFTIVTQPLGIGLHTIEIKSIDQAGNSASTKIDVKVN